MLILVCKVGAWRDGENCTWCGIGTYKNLTGDMDCSVCPINQTTLDIGSTECGMFFLSNIQCYVL